MQTAQANRASWLEFVENNLGQAIREYEAADKLAERQAALDRIHKALETSRAITRTTRGRRRLEREAAVNDLVNQPNLHIRADLATVRPYFERNLITNGPVYRKQYVSQLTAGPKTAFGLLTSDDGIAFFNSQRYTNVTPIWDFHDNLAADEQGQRVAKMYHFECTTFDWAEVTITTVISTAGISLRPCYHHTIDARITSEPVCDHHAHVVRTLASVAGFDQQAINDRVYKESVEKFKERIPIETQEQGEEKTSEEAAKRNADLREKYLVGDDSVALGARLLISKVALGSRPEGILANGVFQWRDAAPARGADMPVPTQLPRPETGTTAVIHPASMLTNLATGLLQIGDWRTVENVMIIVKPVPPGAPPREALEIHPQRSLPHLCKDGGGHSHESQGQGHCPQNHSTEPAARFRHRFPGFFGRVPSRLPTRCARAILGARGVIGPPAKIYRIKMPNVELAASYQVDLPSPRCASGPAQGRRLHAGSRRRSAGDR